MDLEDPKFLDLMLKHLSESIPSIPVEGGKKTARL